MRAVLLAALAADGPVRIANTFSPAEVLADGFPSAVLVHVV